MSVYAKRLGVFIDTFFKEDCFFLWRKMEVIRGNGLATSPYISGCWRETNECAYQYGERDSITCKIVFNVAQMILWMHVEVVVQVD
jgi:hypothetical protein